MLNSAFELGEELNLRTISYKLHPNLWNRYDLSKIDLKLDNWTTIKYLNEYGTDFNDEINYLPSDRGGLYMFSIHCPIIQGRTEYPAYIGRALLTEGQNLKKRCKEYFTKYFREGERPKITTLFKYWAKDLYLSFLVMDENAEIKDYETKLINSLLLPFNDEIPEKKFKQAKKAFDI